MEFEPNFSPENNKKEKKEKEEGLTQKEREWKDKMEEVDRIVDGKGEHIDEGIKKTVAAFLVHDIRTSQSCEGPPDGDLGRDYPWVGFKPDVKGKHTYDLTEKEREIAIEKSREMKKKIVDLLSEFYEDRDVDFKYMLNFEKVGYGFSLHSTAAELIDIADKKDQNYKKIKKEMDDFTEFLKEKHFKEDKQN